MIGNDQELAVTRERMAMMEKLLEALRQNTRPDEWSSLSSGYQIVRATRPRSSGCKARSWTTSTKKQGVRDESLAGTTS